jgi:hypothetical protein
MSKNWPKEDRHCWEKSEVMKSFETQILANFSKIEKLANALDAKNTETVMKNTAVAAAQATTAIKNFKQELNSADDGLVESAIHESDTLEQHSCNAEDCMICSKKGGDYAADEVALAKTELLQQLRKMAQEAISERNIKLAYRIERTIAEMEEDSNDQ